MAAALPSKEAVQEYLAKHKLQEHFEAALQHVCTEMPDDPLAAAAKFLTEKRQQVQRWDMSLLFGQFDADGDGKLDMHEFGRAFRALGLKKRTGEKLEMDVAMFKSFDTNGDGVVDLKELDAGLLPKTRRKIEEKLDAGWKFDAEAWAASVARHSRWNMSKAMEKFDADGDNKLDIYELARAFRAIGLQKRTGEKMEVDKAMFKSFDTNGDGYVSTQEFEANLSAKTRKKIEEKLDGGWRFDKAAWDASVARHNKYNMAEIFKCFDSDNKGKLDIYTLARGFRALGLGKRDGTKMDMDKAMFKSFDTNGDGFVSLEEFQENLKPKTRKKIEQKLEGGWKFDAEAWAASQARHKKYNMADIFKNFDSEGTGKLDIYTIARGFRALGLGKRDGTKMEMDKAMFKSFDTNGDGSITLEEFEENLKPKTRKKIEQKLEEGWKFDAEAWAASVARHKKYDMAVVFKQFDNDGDDKLTLREFMRAFRAIGLEKRSGEKMAVDEAMFKSFDTNGDGVVTLAEFQENLLPKTRKKIEMKLAAGWTFDAEKWKASCDRHAIGE